VARRGKHSFPREQRLRKRSDFTAIQSNGSRVVVDRFVFLLRARPDQQPPRLGITVSRKYGNAVERNRLKRLVREAFRLASPPLVPPGIDLVVIAGGQAGSIEPRLSDVLERWQAVWSQLCRRAEELHRKLAESPDSTHTSPGPGPAAGRKVRT